MEILEIRRRARGSMAQVATEGRPGRIGRVRREGVSGGRGTMRVVAARPEQRAEERVRQTPKGVPAPPEEPNLEPPKFGFVEHAERMNSRAAMVCAPLLREDETASLLCQSIWKSKALQHRRCRSASSPSSQWSLSPARASWTSSASAPAGASTCPSEHRFHLVFPSIATMLFFLQSLFFLYCCFPHS